MQMTVAVAFIQLSIVRGAEFFVQRRIDDRDIVVSQGEAAFTRSGFCTLWEMRSAPTQRSMALISLTMPSVTDCRNRCVRSGSSYIDSMSCSFGTSFVVVP